MLRLWQGLHLLALDVPLIALSWQWVWLERYGIAQHWLEPSLLVVVVWGIYLADRLLDVRHLTRLELSARHAFYARYALPMRWLLCVLLATAVVLSLRLEAALLQFGALLAAGVGLYLWGAQRRGFPKEVMAAVIFSLGVSGAVWVQQPSWRLAAACGALSYLCLLNMSALACIDYQADQAQGQPSLWQQRSQWWYWHWLLWGLALLLFASFGQGVYILNVLSVGMIVYAWQRHGLESTTARSLLDVSLALTPLLLAQH